MCDSLCVLSSRLKRLTENGSKEEMPNFAGSHNLAQLPPHPARPSFVRENVLRNKTESKVSSVDVPSYDLY